MRTIFFSSHDVSKPDSGSYLSEVRNLYILFLFSSSILSCVVSMLVFMILSRKSADPLGPTATLTMSQ